MKQKRKVKSLISSTEGSNLFLTGLLFLLGGILVFGAVSLFTSSVGVEAATPGDNEIVYDGLSDHQEMLLKFGLIPNGGTTPVNEMYLTGTTFVISGDAGISVDISNRNATNKYINYLGGESMNISSNNITIIGGYDDAVYDNNDNATILGGNGNKIEDGNNKVAPVILGGKNNKIGSNQNGNVIVGGLSNIIENGGSYDVILGGSDNVVRGDRVIVGGARVKVNGKSDLFAFSYDSSNDFEPQGGNAFYLNFKKGLGLNKTAATVANVGVDSYGAVSFGEIDINTQRCTADDAGVQGSWNGCLVGCTTSSAELNWKWEMIDHGTGCEALCVDNTHCMISSVADVTSTYTSYCTTGGVNTGNSHHCGGESNVLPTYQNVLFETKLIDSDDTCPESTSPNRCVFKCDGGYHLTGADANGNGGKCYKDCELPWDGTKIKHNEEVIAYKQEDAYCSYDADSQKGPYTCNNYKATLVCDDGSLKIKQSFTSSENGKLASSYGYQYSGCMLHQYRCNYDVYKYSYSDIVDPNKFNDTVSSWGITNRLKTYGTRGEYKLCIDYDAQTQDTEQYLNGDNCFARNYVSASPKHYNLNYQWVGCRSGYHTGAGYETVCMKDCTLDGKTIRHNETMPAYKVKSPTCPNVCEEETFTCNDGHLVSNKAGVNTGTYKYSSCSPKAVTCAGYGISASTYNAHNVESIYSSCQKYSVGSDIFSCTTGDVVYKLDDCINDYHTENGRGINNQYCVQNYRYVNCRSVGATATAGTFHYNVINVRIDWTCGWKGTTTSCWETADACSWDCNSEYHKVDGECISNTSTAPCTESGGPAHSYYLSGDVPITYNGNTGEWSTPANCEWSCEDGYQENGNQCDKIPDPVDGDCGSDPTHYDCEAGTATGKTTTETEYQWICEGLNGGNNSNLCTEPRSQKGWCKDVHWGCYRGNDISHNETDDEYTWTCDGINGGDPDYCSETKESPCECEDGYDTITVDARLGCSDYSVSGAASCYELQCSGDGLSVIDVCYKNGDSPSCGSANGGTYSSTPTSNLCSKGTASSVTTFVSDGVNTRSCGNGYTTYTWSCSLGGNYVNCAACGNYVGGKVDGDCGDTHYNCDAGDVDESSKTSTDTEYTWKCKGRNGGNTSPTCREAKKVKGSCKSTHYGCNTGTVINTGAVEGGTEYTWTCEGINGGDSDYCTESCPAGQTLHNGVCASEPITINICPYVTYNSTVTSLNYGCHTDETLDDVYFQADRALPTKVSITSTFTYRSLRNSCNYGYVTRSNTYTINTGNVQSSTLTAQQDVLHRFPTAGSAENGYEQYYDIDFSSSIDKTSYVDSDGQEYTINLFNAPCGITNQLPDFPTTCAAGKYLPKNSTSCSTCPCGSYCPGGTFTKSTTSAQGIYSCESNTYSLTGSSSCNSCPSGQKPNSTQCGCEVDCNSQCEQCYNNLIDCNKNRPNNATSECMVGTPSSSLENACYCYKPASARNICRLIDDILPDPEQPNQQTYCMGYRYTEQCNGCWSSICTALCGQGLHYLVLDYYPTCYTNTSQPRLQTAPYPWNPSGINQVDNYAALNVMPGSILSTNLCDNNNPNGFGALDGKCYFVANTEGIGESIPSESGCTSFELEGSDYYAGLYKCAN